MTATQIFRVCIRLLFFAVLPIPVPSVQSPNPQTTCSIENLRSRRVRLRAGTRLVSESGEYDTSHRNPRVASRWSRHGRWECVRGQGGCRHRHASMLEPKTLMYTKLILDSFNMHPPRRKGSVRLMSKAIASFTISSPLQMNPRYSPRRLNVRMNPGDWPYFYSRTFSVLDRYVPRKVPAERCETS